MSHYVFLNELAENWTEIQDGGAPHDVAHQLRCYGRDSAMSARWANSSRSVLTVDDLSREEPDDTTSFGLCCTNDSYTTQPVLGYVGAPSGQADLLEAVNYLERPSVPISSSSVSAAVRESPAFHSDGFALTPAATLSESTRDMLLEHACRLYELPSGFIPSRLAHKPLSLRIPPATSPEQSFRGQVLPLLLMLDKTYAHHLPTLLLLGCVYYALQDYSKALQTFENIISVDPNYVEAVSNKGSTLSALGRETEAREQWMRALQIDSTYFDSIESLLGSIMQEGVGGNTLAYRQAHELCQALLSRIKTIDVAPHRIHHLQRLYFMSGTSRALMGDVNHPESLQDYVSAIEVSLHGGSRSSPLLTLRDLVIGTCFAAMLICDDPSLAIPHAILHALSTPEHAYSSDMVKRPDFDILRAVHESGDRLIRVISHGGVLPVILLRPEDTDRLLAILFRSSGGSLPALAPLAAEGTPLPQKAIERTNFMTSTCLLSIARRMQELPPRTAFIPAAEGLTLRSSISLDLLLNFLAEALSPSPSTCNNLGILVQSLPNTRLDFNDAGEREIITARGVARAWYDRGLNMNPKHPYLLTNSGSLYKDESKLGWAMKLYKHALQEKPDFAIALTNYGNALKDLNRPWEAAPYFSRAISVDPELPEAVCGLANSRNAIGDWVGRGAINSELGIDDAGYMIVPAIGVNGHAGYLRRVAEVTETQLEAGYLNNIGLVSSLGNLDFWVDWVEKALDERLTGSSRARWRKLFRRFFAAFNRTEKHVNEGGFVVRFAEWLARRLQHHAYSKAWGVVYADSPKAPLRPSDLVHYPRFPISAFWDFGVPAVLPFHTFSYPMAARMIRLIAHRHALRISVNALSQPWLPRHIYPPPAPPCRKINIGYVSSDLTEGHPLVQLMQSVFGLHNANDFNIHMYATNATDNSQRRRQIERECAQFIDCSNWSTKSIVERIVQDNIHILVNLGGYTRGARNDVFATRPAPIQIALMGYPGTMAAGWIDYIVCDPLACPPEMAAAERWSIRRNNKDETSRLQDSFKELDLETDLDAVADPESLSDDWMFSEKFIYMPFTFMVTNHRQASRDDVGLSLEERLAVPSRVLWENEEKRRLKWRQRVFPDLAPETFIFANFNQIYKMCPTIFAAWLRILQQVPNSILWLLRFPAQGEEHLRRLAVLWAGPEVAIRIRFTDVGSKSEHITRARVVDLFLDTTECNAHTTAADVLWSGTPILTWPQYSYKMCSRVCASMARATGFGDGMIATSLSDYESRAIAFARGLVFVETETAPGVVERRATGKLIDLRRNLFLNRDHMPLFDTARWVRDLEQGYREVWRRWVTGTEFEGSKEWEANAGQEKNSTCIWVQDPVPVRFRTLSDQFVEVL
ncbi:unnamed protein product [Peniophora sp. CBMAI 1063]|nr:unnamed protein product [Peniophora sp. CBMAI 1063]